MARVRKRRLFADAPPETDVVGYSWYAGAPSNAQFLAEVDAGLVDPFAETATPEVVLEEGTLPEGNYQFAVVARDGSNWSSPYQHGAWADVPLDLTPPSPCSGGGIGFLD